MRNIASKILLYDEFVEKVRESCNKREIRR